MDQENTARHGWSVFFAESTAKGSASILQFESVSILRLPQNVNCHCLDLTVSISQFPASLNRESHGPLNTGSDT